MLHNQFRAERIFSRWKVRPSYGESATTYFASLVADSEDCTAKTFALQHGLLSGPTPSMRILEAVLRLPLTEDEKSSLVRWTPMRAQDLRCWNLATQRVGPGQLGGSGCYCPECLAISPFHRVWWDIQGFTTCPVHDIALIRPRNTASDNEYLRLYCHGVAQDKLTSPPVLSVNGRQSYEGYLIQKFGGICRRHEYPMLDDQTLEAQIRAIRLIGILLDNPKSDRTVPAVRSSTMTIGFEALKGTATDLEDRISTWLLENHPQENLRHATLDHLGFMRQFHILNGTMRDRLVAAMVSALARHGTLTPKLRMKPGVDVPPHLSALARETNLTRYGLEVLLRMLWPDMPKTGAAEVPREIADRVRRTTKGLIPLDQAAKALGCSPAVARSIAKIFSLDGKVVAVSVNVRGKARLHFIKSHLDWMLSVLDSLAVAPVGLRTVGLKRYAQHHQRGQTRILVDVFWGRRRAFRSPAHDLSKIEFERPPKAGRGGKPMPIGRTHVPKEAMLGCEFWGITGATATAAKELVKQGFIRTHGDKRGLLDRASVLAFHRQYVNPVRYLMGRGMIAIEAIWALKKMDLPLAFKHPTIRPYFAERTELEARIGSLYRTTHKMMERWRELIQQGAVNCPSFIIPEVPGDGSTYVYTSSRMFSFRVLFEGDSLILKARFTPESRRIWNVYLANADIFRVHLTSFSWHQGGDEITATAKVSSNEEIQKATIELGKLATYFRHKMP